MFTVLVLGKVLAIALGLAVVLLALRIKALRDKLAARDARVEKLRSELASSDASAMRLTDKISQLEAIIQHQADGKVITMFGATRSGT